MHLQTFYSDVDELCSPPIDSLTETQSINLTALLSLTEITNINIMFSSKKNHNYQQQDVRIYFFCVFLSVSKRDSYTKGNKAAATAAESGLARPMIGLIKVGI